MSKRGETTHTDENASSSLETPFRGGRSYRLMRVMRILPLTNDFRCINLTPRVFQRQYKNLELDADAHLTFASWKYLENLSEFRGLCISGYGRQPVDSCGIVPIEQIEELEICVHFDV